MIFNYKTFNKIPNNIGKNIPGNKFAGLIYFSPKIIDIPKANKTTPPTDEISLIISEVTIIFKKSPIKYIKSWYKTTITEENKTPIP